MSETQQLPFWRNWGFWGLILLLGRFPFPFNPIAIFINLTLLPILGSTLWMLLPLAGAALCMVGLVRHPHQRGWSIAGLVTLAVYFVIFLIFASRFN